MYFSFYVLIDEVFILVYPQHPDLSAFISVFLQVFADDVLTKEEQLGLLFKAKRKCEGNIKSKPKIHGESQE